MADSDRDGVGDDADKCPNTSYGDSVDTNGCSCSQKTCDDGDGCTTDSCNLYTGDCVFTEISDCLARAMRSTEEEIKNAIEYNCTDGKDNDDDGKIDCEDPNCIGVNRFDSEPACRTNIYLYDIDDLRGIIQINMAERRQEAVKAERVVEEEVLKFEKWLKTLEVVPTIVSLKEKAEAIRQAEIKRSLAGYGEFSPSQMKILETLTLSITEKIMNDPILTLKRKSDRPSRDVYLDTTRKLFNLDQDDGEEN